MLRILLDNNIILDILQETRPLHEVASSLMDDITTGRYIGVKVPHLQAAINDLINYLRDSHPHTLQQVYLFGSCSQGTATQNSDIDLCCVFDNNVSLTSRDMIMFKANLRGSINVDTDIVVCNANHLINPDMRIYSEIKNKGTLLLDFTKQPKYNFKP